MPIPLTSYGPSLPTSGGSHDHSQILMFFQVPEEANRNYKDDADDHQEGLRSAHPVRSFLFMPNKEAITTAGKLTVPMTVRMRVASLFRLARLEW